MSEVDPLRRFTALALRYLSIRDRSTKEVISYLQSKGAPESILETIVNDLTDKKFLDDRSFAQKWLRYRLARGKGERVVRYELKIKGIEDADVTEAFKTVEVGALIESAKQVLTKKGSKFSHLKGFEQKYKMQQILTQKGFSPGVIRAAIDDDPEDRVK